MVTNKNICFARKKKLPSNAYKQIAGHRSTSTGPKRGIAGVLMAIAFVVAKWPFEWAITAMTDPSFKIGSRPYFAQFLMAYSSTPGIIPKADYFEPSKLVPAWQLSSNAFPVTGNFSFRRLQLSKLILFNEMKSIKCYPFSGEPHRRRSNSRYYVRKVFASHVL